LVVEAKLNTMYQNVVLRDDLYMTIRVLLVDDDEDLLIVASKFLTIEDSSFEIDVVSSAEMALEAFNKDPFDVIVCDYEMPHGMSGLEFLELIRRQNLDIPFIVFTGRGREEVAIKALNLGADFYITKGVEPKSLYAELAHTIRTVVNHRRAELALEESDSRFRASFENAAIGMAIVSVDLEVIQVNNALYEILGYEELELLSHNLEDFIHPEDIGKAHDMALSLLQEGEFVPIDEWRFLTKDGQVVWTKTTSSVTRDAKGTPLYFVSQIQDITEAKLTTEALLDSEMRFRGAFHGASIGMALVSFKESIVDANQALCQMLGYSREELIEITFTAITHPEDIDNTPVVVDGTFEDGKSTIQLEKRYIHKNGHTVYTFISSSIGYNEENEPIYFVTQFQDITEAKLASDALATSEANYRSLIENSIQSYAIIQDECYAYVNEPFAKTLGLSRNEALNLNTNQIWELIHPDDIEGLKKRNASMQSGEVIAPRNVFRYVRKDGSVRWVEGHIHPTEFNGKPALQIVEVDITERRATELALQGSLDFLDTLLNTISSPVFYKDAKGKYQRCNVAFANKLLGATVDEVIGKTSDILLKRIRGLNREDLIQLDRKLLEGGRDQSFEIAIEDMYGTFRDYQVNRTFFMDQEGKPIGIVGVLLDVTERRRALENLERERLAFRIIAEAAVHTEDIPTLCENVLEGLIEVLDFDFGTIRIINNEDRTIDLVALCGLKSRIGRRIVEKIPLDDMRYLASNVAAKGDPIFAPKVKEHEIYRTNQERIDKFNMEALMSWPLRSASGELVGILQVVSRKQKDLSKIDVHFFEIVAGMFATVLESKRAHEALRQSEARFRSTFEAIPQPSFLWELKQDGEIVLRMVNQAAITMSEGTVIASVGTQYSGLFEANSELLKIIHTTLRTGKAMKSEQEFSIPHSKERRWVTWHSTRPIANTVLLIATDITGHRQLEQSLSRQKEELSDFANIMNHDLQGTLHNALVYTELLEDQYEKEYITGIHDMLDSAQAILKRSIMLADAGLVIGEKEVVNLNKLVDEVVKREIGVAISFQRDDLPSVSCDRFKMTQILVNLFRNAVEHGKPSLIEIRHSSTVAAHRLFFSNDGVKIPDEIRDSILKQKISTKDVGGLGLMIVRKLVEAHGWSIKLDNGPNTTFIIQIPLSET